MDCGENAGARVEMMGGVLIGVLTTSSRSGIGRRDTCWCVVSLVPGDEAGVHTTRDIDPDDPVNMPALLAFELTQ